MVSTLLRSIGLGDFATVQRKLSLGLTQASPLIAGHVFTFGHDTFNFGVSTFIILYIAFCQPQCLGLLLCGLGRGGNRESRVAQ